MIIKKKKYNCLSNFYHILIKVKQAIVVDPYATSSIENPWLVSHPLIIHRNQIEPIKKLELVISNFLVAVCHFKTHEQPPTEKLKMLWINIYRYKFKYIGMYFNAFVRTSHPHCRNPVVHFEMWTLSIVAAKGARSSFMVCVSGSTDVCIPVGNNTFRERKINVK